MDEYPHPLFEFYRFPKDVFDKSFNADYASYPLFVQQRGGRNYYTPIGWTRYGINTKSRYLDSN